MAKEVISDKEGVVVKRLSSPKKNTVIDANFRMSSFDDDVSSLNAGAESSGGSEKKGLAKAVQAEAVAARKKTLVGNEGPDADGKIDWDKSQDCLDYVFQAHESSNNSNDEEGYEKTAAKCVNSFNKLFGKKDESGVHQSAKVTAEDIATALKQYYVPDAEAAPSKSTRPRPASNARTEAAEEREEAPKKAPPKEELYFPLGKASLEFSKNKLLLSGTHFEICKVLSCKHICMVQRKSGPIEHNGLFHAACGNSENNQIDKKNCPQEQELSEKELFLFQMFLQQFNGDALQAKKLFFLSRAIQNK